jgi:hypothetical protein
VVGVNDPQLGALADNGGETLTHRLLSGSPAFNAGSYALAFDTDGSPLQTDQRGPGFARILGGTVDIGAFELEPPAGFSFIGFFAPISNDAINTVKAGQAVPLKWRLLDAEGQPVTNIAAVTLTSVETPCEGSEAGEPVPESAAGNSGLQNLGDGYYQFNWKTSKTHTGSCRQTRLDLGNGLIATALFHFKN